MNKGSLVMLKATRMALLIVGMLLSAAGIADDAVSPKIDDQAPPMVTLSVDALLAKPAYAPRWLHSHPIDAMDYPDYWPSPIATFEFQEADAWARVSKLRSLSLLTLAEFDQTRLFLGVNEDGMVGLHLRARPQHGDGRYLEFVRMPYLKETEPHDEVEPLGPQLNADANSTPGW
jgi:hypothetical protein